MGRKWIIALVVAFVLLGSNGAFAWGPGTHTKLACDLLGQLQLLPVAMAALLARHGKDYLFGNIAADVVVGKRLSRVKQLCHHWKTGFQLLDEAHTDQSKAFALGYLSHLAADTVSHGHYLPRQMTLTRSSMNFGHLYWELRADSTVGPYYWHQLQLMMKEVFVEHRATLALHLTDTFLPFDLNWQLFYRMNRFMGRRLWRRAMDRWYGVSRWRLSDQLIREYRAEALARMIDVLVHLRNSPVLHEDPNGNAALAFTRMQRRQLRQMTRAGLGAIHVLHEAARLHRPLHCNVPPHGIVKAS